MDGHFTWVCLRAVGAGNANTGPGRVLRQLVDPALEQLLVGAQIRELIGARRRKTRQ